MGANQLSEREEHIAEGWRMRYYCAKKGWEQIDLAHYAGLTEKQVCYAFCGDNISRKNMIKISRALEVERWRLCKFDKDWKKTKPLVLELEAKVKLRKGKLRKRLGIKGKFILLKQHMKMLKA